VSQHGTDEDLYALTLLQSGIMVHRGVVHEAGLFALQLAVPQFHVHEDVSVVKFVALPILHKFGLVDVSVEYV
jgi:hypothetical protein